jgi:signal peptidase I
MEDDASSKKSSHAWRETVILLVIALLTALVIKTFLAQAFYIPSESMEPGLVKNDRILVQKVSYWGGGSPKRGDVVVFEDPGGWLSPSEDATASNILTKALTKIGLYPVGGHLVKRVIGVAGDTIVCCDKQGRLSVNGKALDEDDFIAPQTGCDGPMPGTCKWTAGPVPDGSLFVMGDNRANSADSSDHLCTATEPGCEPGDEFVPTDLVVGKVALLFWPLSRFGFLHRPDAFDDVPDPKN